MPEEQISAFEIAYYETCLDYGMLLFNSVDILRENSHIEYGLDKHICTSSYSLNYAKY